MLSDLVPIVAITFGVGLDGEVENPQLVANDIVTALRDAAEDMFDSDCTIGPAVLTFDQGAERGSIQGSVSFVGGAGRGNSTPPNVAVLARKVTARVGRAGRGRLFLPWVVSAAEVNEQGVLQEEARNGVENFLEQFLIEMAAIRAGLRMVILHDQTVSNANVPSLVTALPVENVVATQRRRLRS